MKRFVFFEFIYFCSYIRVRFQLVAFIREHIWHKSSLMTFSMRLELTCVFSLWDFQLVMGSYCCLPLFFLECIYLRVLYTSLIFDRFSSSCMCVCVCWSGLWFHKRLFFLSVCVSERWGFFRVWISVGFA